MSARSSSGAFGTSTAAGSPGSNLISNDNKKVAMTTTVLSNTMRLNIMRIVSITPPWMSQL
jgi:hypothetical protein